MSRHECEAEDRIKMALYEMTNSWAAGTFDLGKIKGILTGPACQHAAPVQVSDPTPK